MLKRKEFEAMFLPFKKSGTQIWVITKIKELPIELIRFAINLAELDFIKFIRIDANGIAASSENYPNRPKVPITQMTHSTAIGIEVLYDLRYKIIDFFDINSPIKGHGGKMAEAILKDFPEGWQPLVFNDWSDGFWDKIKEKYKHLDWMNDPFED
ncbi:hypothetical protein [Belliella aquatica]|uniref:Uncharacterized protein n=1 Tax=Belliella aquatica TaxID=1323734 RepID=A0ABQ1LUG4_9BACT|nr:hypothetical protein [Belliella aquatica]MCH7405883.1 hypothetical protein [Belliella aquatica]GGC29985.1 hypothetical protein GCM10010993_06120 [Belliella aquatica]